MYSIKDPYPLAVCSGSNLPGGAPVSPETRTFSNSCTIKVYSPLLPYIKHVHRSNWFISMVHSAVKSMVMTIMHSDRTISVDICGRSLRCSICKKSGRSSEIVTGIVQVVILTLSVASSFKSLFIH